jgi:methylmalonyl-CoA/ethylmalonyl-CoA epimerase
MTVPPPDARPPAKPAGPVGFPVGSSAGLPEGAVLGIDHVGVATADLERTIGFYRDSLGLVEVRRELNEDQQVIEAMLAPAAAAGTVVIGGTAGTGLAGAPAQLQVLAPTSPGSAVARFLDRAGPGLQHLAFRVADLDDLSDRLRHRGGRLLYPRPGRGTAGSLINFVHPRDTGGVLVELVQTTGVHAAGKPGIAGAER